MSKRGLTSFKIILLGDQRVGKTSLARRYMGEGFKENYLATLGADFVVKEYKNHQLLIWDIGGHKNFEKFYEAYLYGGQGLILVFDVIRPETLLSISKWVDYFIKANKNIVPGIVVANKIDLREPNDNSVLEEEVQKYIAKLYNKYKSKFQFIETSALTGENIEQAFENVVDELIDNMV